MAYHGAVAWKCDGRLLAAPTHNEGGHMKGREPILVMVVVLTAVGLLGRGLGPRNHAPTAAVVVDDPSQTKATLDTPIETDLPVPLLGFAAFRSSPGAVPSDLNSLLKSLGGVTVESLIVTLPDPEESRFRYQFDRELDCIQRAVESQGYVLDRYELPWSSGPRLSAAATKAKSNDPQPATAPQARESRPGVILYRRETDDPKTPSLLMLLLVGETPTWGVQKPALARAIRWAHQLRPARPHEINPIRILGPCFSGGAESLAGVVHQTRSFLGDREVWICTGSATSVDRNRFRAQCGPHVRFAATVVPDGLMTDYLLEALDHPERTERVAVLTEGGTLYGSAALSKEVGKKSGSVGVLKLPFPIHISQVRSEHQREELESSPRTVVGPSSRMPIPLEETGNSNDMVPTYFPKMSAPTDSLIVSDLLATISRERIRYVGIVATDTRDIIFLTQLIRRTAPDVKLFLVGSDLRLTHPAFANDFRGAVVASTYPLDARAQEWTYPFHGDRQRLLFAHDVDFGVYNATIFLLNGKPHDRGPNGEALDFDPNGKELNLASLKIEANENPNNPAKDLLVYGMPFEPIEKAYGTGKRKNHPLVDTDTRPVVWVGMIGNHDLIPLRTFQLDSDTDRNRAAARDEARKLLAPVVRKRAGLDAAAFLGVFSPRPPSGWNAVVIGTSLLAIGLAVLVGAMGSNRLRRGSRRAKPRGLTPAQKARLARRRPGLDMRRRSGLPGFAAVLLNRKSEWVAKSRFWASVAGVTFAAVLAYLFRAYRPSLRLGFRSYTDAFACGTIFFALVAVVVAVVLIQFEGWGLISRAFERFAKLPKPPSIRRRLHETRAGYMTTASLLAALAAAMAIATIVWCVRGSVSSDECLLVRRLVALNSGVSPAIPVMFLGAALVVLAIAQLNRLHLVSTHLHGNPFEVRGPDASGERTASLAAIERFNEQNRRVFKRLQYSLQGSRLGGLPVALILGLVLTLAAVRFPGSGSVEGGSYDIPFFLILVGVLAAMAMTLGKLIVVWQEIAALFCTIDALPMACAFARLSDRVANDFGRFLQAGTMDSGRPRILEHQLGLVRRAYGPKVRDHLTAELKLSDEAVARIDHAMQYGDASVPPRAAPAPLRERRPSETLAPVSGGAPDDKAVSPSATPRLTAAILPALTAWWAARPLREAYDTIRSDDEKGGSAKDKEPPAPGIAWLTLAEDYLAIRAVGHIGQFAAHLRSMFALLTFVPLALLLAGTWYPFEPRRLLSLLIWVMILAATITAVGIMVQVERNDFVSRVSRTRANSVTFDRTFLSNIATFLVPVVAFLLAEFPDVAFWVNSLFEPLGPVIR